MGRGVGGELLKRDLTILHSTLINLGIRAPRTTIIMTTTVLDRDLTNDALVAYLAADEKLQPLASCLADASRRSWPVERRRE